MQNPKIISPTFPASARNIIHQPNEKRMNQRYFNTQSTCERETDENTVSGQKSNILTASSIDHE